MVIDISPKNKNTEQDNFSFKKLWIRLQNIGSIPAKEKIFFVKNLQVMIRSGLALDKGLRTLAEQTTNKHFQKILKDLAQDTEKGLAFSESLKKYESIFGGLFVNMVEAGEISGRMEDVLSQIYLQLKKTQELKSKIIGALTYPIIVVASMLLIGIGMIIFVVPKITSIFKELNTDLPLPTKILIGISDFVVNHGIFSATVAILCVSGVILSMKLATTRKTWHWLYISLPIFGPIVKKINLAKFCRTLSSLMKSDIAITKAFETTSMVVSNLYYREALNSSIEKLKSGVSMTEVVSAYHKLFPPVVTQMIASGEETGTVDEILGELAGFYEEEIDQTMKTLPTIIEPVLMLVLGVGVGLMAVAIIMPMYSITQNI